MPVRLRDFIVDSDGWLYAVSTYDNDEKVGCVLRYVPDDNGERIDPSGKRYKKYDFEDAYAFIAEHKPYYSNLVQRIPVNDVKKVLKPDVEISGISFSSHPCAKTPGSFQASIRDYWLYRIAPLRARK